MFWHNKREETPEWKRQGCAPARLDGQLALKGENQNLAGGGGHVKMKNFTWD